MPHRVAPRAEADLDGIWLYVAKDSGSIEIANRLIDNITDRFFTLSRFPYIGRSREDFGPGYRSLAVGEYVILYRVESDEALILRVVHGRRDLEEVLALERTPLAPYEDCMGSTTSALWQEVCGAGGVVDPADPGQYRTRFHEPG